MRSCTCACVALYGMRIVACMHKTHSFACGCVAIKSHGLVGGDRLEDIETQFLWPVRSSVAVRLNQHGMLPPRLCLIAAHGMRKAICMQRAPHLNAQPYLCLRCHQFPLGVPQCSMNGPIERVPEHHTHISSLPFTALAPLYRKPHGCPPKPGGPHTFMLPKL
jgi:hypothetical protein